MTAPARTLNPATSTRPERSSRRIAHKPPLRWLPWLLLLLLAALVAAVLLTINAVDDDGAAGPAGDSLGQAGGSGAAGADGREGDSAVGGDESGAGAAQDGTGAGPGPSGAAGATGGSGGSAAGGALTADGQDLLAVAGASLAGRAGQAVTGAGPVQSVPSDEGFWVGSSERQRVYVFLTPEARGSQGESGFTVRAGQTVRLRGSIARLDQAPAVAAGVEAAEGRAQLDQQAAYVRADAITFS